MSIKLGNSAIGSLKVGSSTVLEIRKGADLIYPSSVYPLQYWVVEPCGGGSQSSLAIDVGVTLTAGQAVRPVLEPLSTTTLPGYETPKCWTLISTTTSGTYCGIRAPAASCSQSVCL